MVNQVEINRGVLPERGPAVSIVVRSRGRRRSWLQAALRSIDRQTYPAVETVLIEDGPGALADLARSLALGPGRALRYRFASELGRSRAGNLGLQVATGCYVGFLDDDELDPGHAALLVAALEAHPEWGAVVARALEVPVRSTAEDAGWPAAGRVVGPTAVSRALLHAGNLMPTQAVLARADLLHRVGGFDPELIHLEDWDLWLRCTALMPFGTIDAVTSRFRVPASRRGRQERAARHAPWRAKVMAKLAASDSPVPRGDVAAAQTQIRERLEDYVSARALAQALFRRAWAVLRGRN
jgi:glycosyltransferase involved in cell wall biosynthesis